MRQLQALYAEYRAAGFEVLAFPSNEFLSQEPLADPDIRRVATERFGAQFQLMAKVTSCFCPHDDAMVF